MLTPILVGCSPYFELFGRQPNYKFLRTFGSACYPWTRPYNSSKLQPRSVRCVFLGYDSTAKGYRFFDPLSKWVYISRYVLFWENVFPFASSSQSNASACPDAPILGLDPNTQFSDPFNSCLLPPRGAPVSGDSWFESCPLDQQLVFRSSFQPLEFPLHRSDPSW